MCGIAFTVNCCICCALQPDRLQQGSIGVQWLSGTTNIFCKFFQICPLLNQTLDVAVQCLQQTWLNLPQPPTNLLFSHLSWHAGSSTRATVPLECCPGPGHHTGTQYLYISTMIFLYCAWYFVSTLYTNIIMTLLCKLSPVHWLQYCECGSDFQYKRFDTHDRLHGCLGFTLFCCFFYKVYCWDKWAWRQV